MDYKELMIGYKDDMVKTLQELVQKPSVLDVPVSDNGVIYPFGVEIEECYQSVLELGKNMGFEVKDVDHYGGHIEFSSCDEGAKTFGIIAHVDVVPAGEGWTYDPFGGEIADGYIYGRGTTDDKGPLVAVLYVMKAFKDLGLQPKNNIRLMVGLDEETGMNGVKYYLEREKMPDFGITPDGNFPVIQAELGFLTFELDRRIHCTCSENGLVISKLSGGTAANVVPGSAKCTLKSSDKTCYDEIINRASAYTAKTGYALKTKKSGSVLNVEAIGKSCHGAYPENGVNAISILMDFLGCLDICNDGQRDFVDFYNSHIGFDVHGERLGCGFEDEISGKLVCNIGIAELDDEIASLTVNIRYPVTIKGEDVISGISAVLEDSNIGIVLGIDEAPVYQSLESDLVQNLMEAYSEVTGDYESKPVISPGGTYAKQFENMLCFGCEFPGGEERMHQADERISIDDFMLAAEVLAAAIHKICF